MQSVVIVIHLMIVAVLIATVLLQRSEGGGFVGGGSPSGMMSVRGAGDLLTRTTWILGAAFFTISLLLTILAGREKGASSVVDRLKIDAVNPALLNQTKPVRPPAGTAQPGGPQSAPSPLQAPTPTVNNPFLGQTQQPAPPAGPPPK